MSKRRYTLIEVLGAGGYGEVWRARMHNDAGFTRECAIKLLKHGADEDAARRLRDEARILGMLQHRSVVQVFDLTQIGGRWAVVMELIEGVPLSYFTRYGGRVPLRPTLEIVCQVAEVLVALGEARAPDGSPLELLHRDIKPSNIQLTADGQIKVLDFGVAQARFQAREADTTGVGYGTRAYMAPERARHGVAGPEADVFALGVVLVELLTGRRFGVPATDEGALRTQREAALAQLVDAPPALLSLLRETLSHDPQARPSAADTLTRARLLLSDETDPVGLADWAAPQVRRLLEATGPSATALAALGRIATTTAKGALRWGLALALAVGVTTGLAVASVLGVLPAMTPQPPAPQSSAPQSSAPQSSAPLSSASGVAPSLLEEPAPLATAEAHEAPLQPQAAAPNERASTAGARRAALPASAASATVELRGDVQEVVLIGAAGRFSLPAQVPPGRYQIEAVFPRWGRISEDELVVPTAGTVLVSCSNLYGSCGLAGEP